MLLYVSLPESMVFFSYTQYMIIYVYTANSWAGCPESQDLPEVSPYVQKLAQAVLTL